ncbi:MAG TPA: DUF445 family protein, partial [Actinomycetes bacterium]|nr:DUF445 family protein [Actinomycetes bacterium]
EVLAAGRRTVLELVDDPTSELRVRSRDLLASWGAHLTVDTRAAAKVDGWLAQAAVYVVEGYREEITRLITDTVDRWDGRETARRIELQVGRDLQFIRLNGTVVGSLVGVLIHAFSQLL